MATTKLVPPVMPEYRRRIGSIGGKASAARLSPQQRIERSTKAGNTTLHRYGLGFYHSAGQRSSTQMRAKREAAKA